MSKEEDKELVSRLLKAANEIHKKGLAKANYIHLPAKFIQQRADEEGVTFDEMVKIIEEESKPKQR
jgi:phosphotransacetylase